jgi:hypothetical protein
VIDGTVTRESEQDKGHMMFRFVGGPRGWDTTTVLAELLLHTMIGVKFGIVSIVQYKNPSKTNVSLDAQKVMLTKVFVIKYSEYTPSSSMYETAQMISSKSGCGGVTDTPTSNSENWGPKLTVPLQTEIQEKETLFSVGLVLQEKLM